jgi:Mg2+ and Co2+ transporter CorA
LSCPSPSRGAGYRHRELAAHEVAAFITRNALVTVHKDRGFHIDDVVRRWDNTNVGAVTTGFLLTARGNRLSVITKQVTSWAAIIAVPTAVTGFYGQNVPYPGFGHTAGFWTSTLVILGMSAFLYVIFRRKEWL